ncbi:MAG TPA: pilus assembly protein PilY, partial [Ramlibacter sp.]|nr:pilus assembly protein PilY [Ramlibacter sp.]
TAGSPLQALNGTAPTTGRRADPAATAAQLASVQDTITSSCGTSTLETAENKGAYGLNWARYMKANSITTYSVGILGPSCDSQYGAWLTKLGSTEVGGGKFFSVNNYDDLVRAFKIILGEVQSINSVFAAVSLPVSVNTQGSYLNQVYVGMFRPDKNFFPRWNGNLKQYKLGNVNNVLRLQDADSKSAINTLTGFVTECARSYWTPNAADTYWSLDPQGGCLTVTGGNASNYPDGNIVEKGAQAYKVRALTPADRVVKTCSTSFASCTSMTNFDTSNSSVTASLSNALINWARGTNTADELDKGTAVMRPSTHGDIVHSRPIPVNHGTDASPSIVVYYGGNDGLLRAINGNRNDPADVTVGQIVSGGNTYPAGAEMWSFMPPEFYSKITRLNANTKAIFYPGTNNTDTAPKDYGFDGPITAFNGSTPDGTRTYVYATMRRGGRAVYAFNVTTPGSPTLLWKRGCPNLTNDTDCSTGFEGIGQTWASLKPMYVTGYNTGLSPLMITGGGYDDCEDHDAGTAGGANHNCTVAAKGAKVYVLDAKTGAIARAFDTDRPVVADTTLVRDSNDKVIYGYTADMGGNVYRMNFSGGTDTWTITKLASFGCDTVGACTANRKFMFAPSVVTTDSVIYSVMLGSGDREKPVKDYVSAKSVSNYFFKFDDKPIDATYTTDTVNCGVSTTVLCKAALLGILSSADPTDGDLATKKGWYLGLASTEQVVTSSITIFGVVTFSTHQPAVTAFNTCTPNLGTTLVYNISYINASTANGTTNRYEDVSGDGLPPSPVGGRVTLDDGTTVPFCIGCSKDSPLEGSPPKALGTVIQPKSRLYWYIQK